MPGRRNLAAIAAVIAAVAALFFPSLIGLTVLSPADQVSFFPPFDVTRPAEVTRASNSKLGDVNFDITPHVLGARRQIREGDLPLWNPYTGSGRPLIAWQQAAPFYPVNFLAYVFPYLPAQAWVVGLKLVLTGLGMLVLGRALGLSRAGAAMGAVPTPGGNEAGVASALTDKSKLQEVRPHGQSSPIGEVSPRAR